MTENNEQSNNLQATLAQLLDFQTNQSYDQGNTLILLSLVNLMGILNVLNKKVGGPVPNITAAGRPPADLAGLTQMMGPVMNMLARQGQSGNSEQNTNQNSNQNLMGPLMNLLGDGKGLASLAPLLSLLGGGGQGNQNMDLSALMNIFNGLMGAKPSGSAENNTANTGNKDENNYAKEPVTVPENDDKKENGKIIVEKRKEPKKQSTR